MKSLAMCAAGLFLPTLHNVHGQTPCVDDNGGLAAVARENGIDNISGCADISCASNGQLGAVIQRFCCATCSDAGVGQGETVLPGQGEMVMPGSDAQVDLFLLSGQSNCVGLAQVSDLELPSMASKYPELQDEQSGVWFAGYQYVLGNSPKFFVNKLMAGRDRSLFGPEISLGERIHSVTGRPTVIVKYCVGGTSAWNDWNPDTAANGWDKAADDGTAAWMKENAGLDFGHKAKQTLFKNMVYTMRMTMEALDSGGVPYKWRGITWVQGQSDRTGWFRNNDGNEDGFWEKFGQDTARVWQGFKAHMGLSAEEQQRVVVIDSGGSASSEMISGKYHAIDLMPGCQGINVDFIMGCMDPASTCYQSPTESCLGKGFSFNWDVFNYYGYDPNFPEEAKPDAFSPKEFRWFTEYPVNQHAAIEGMIMIGRDLANAYIDSFTDFQLPSEYTNSASMRFPIKECGAQVQSCSADNFCYSEKRAGPGCKQPLAPAPPTPPKVSSAHTSCPPASALLILVFLATFGR